MIDEKSRRREDFAGGIPITLGDGQEWSFPAIRADGFYARELPDGEIVWRGGFHLGLEYDRLFDLSIDAEDGLERISALVKMAAFALGINYDLTFVEVASLLRRYPEGHGKREAAEEIWIEVERALLGFGKKPSPVG